MVSSTQWSTGSPRYIHPHICLFLDVCQVFICFRFSIYKFIDIETYFRIWNTYKIGTYRGIRKTRVIYIEDYLYHIVSNTQRSMTILFQMPSEVWRYCFNYPANHHDIVSNAQWSITLLFQILSEVSRYCFKYSAKYYDIVSNAQWNITILFPLSNDVSRYCFKYKSFSLEALPVFGC